MALGIRAFVGVPCVHEGHWIATIAVNCAIVRDWQAHEIALLQEFVARLWSMVEHTRAIDQLRQSEAEFRQLANAMPQIVWICDGAGHLEFVNDRWTEYTGLSLEQSRDRTLMEQIIPPEDNARINEVFTEAIANRSSYQSEFRLIRPDGGYRYFLVRATPIQNDQGEIEQWYGTSTDVTDLKQLEAERSRLLVQEQSAREQAERANQIKDEFLAVLSHELRTPMNPILGWASLLKQGKLSAEKATEAIATIERNARLQVQLIDDLLDISRILRGKLTLTVEPVDLSVVIAAASETVQLAADAKLLQFDPIASPSIAIVNGDAGRLQQVVWNLLSNAIKFTPHGGQISVELTTVGRYAQIQVRDTGKGINPEFLPYLFEHFRQEDAATTRKFGGLGLGLAIARQIVELHGGQIRAESLGEAQGATFTVQLPLASQIERSPTSDSVPIDAGDLMGIQILVVDDEPDSREFVAFVLEQAGAIVTRAASGIEALEQIQQSPPDVIVSDIGMPDLDGYMLMQETRLIEAAKQIPAIALTAFAGELDQKRALSPIPVGDGFAAGFNQHLAKPVDPDQLVKAIRGVYDRTPNQTGLAF